MIRLNQGAATVPSPRHHVVSAPDGAHAQDGDGLRKVGAGGDLGDTLAADAEHLPDLVGADEFAHMNYCTGDYRQAYTRHMPTLIRRRKIEDPLWDPFRLYIFGAMSALSYWADIPWTFWVFMIPGLFVARAVLRKSSGRRSEDSK